MAGIDRKCAVKHTEFVAMILKGTEFASPQMSEIAGTSDFIALSSVSVWTHRPSAASMELQRISSA